MNNSAISNFTSLCLKSIGVILIASSLLDYATLAFPFQPLDSEWQINFAVQAVDRGIVPMVGIAFILVSYWIESSLGSGRSSKFDIKLPAFILSLFLGGVFFLLVPLHVNNFRLASSDALVQIERKISQAENTAIEQYQELNNIVNNPQSLPRLTARIQEIDKAINSGELQGQKLAAWQRDNLAATKSQLQSFQKLAENPAALEARLGELRAELQEQRTIREKQAKTEALKQGIRTGLSSLMLAVGYLLIGWFGIKLTGGSQPSGKRVSAS